MSMQIYFLQRGEGGPIKIGKSRKVQDRIRSLKTGSAERLVLLAVYRGGDQAEKYLHHCLAAHRLEGEWFNAHADVLSVVEAVKAGAFKPGAFAPVTRDEGHAARMMQFLAESFSRWLQIAYGKEPGWARLAATDAGVSVETAKEWVRGPRMPHTANVLNLCKRNCIIQAWFATATVACWMAHELGVTEEEAFRAALVSPGGVTRVWKCHSAAERRPVFEEIWNTRELNVIALQPERG